MGLRLLQKAVACGAMARRGRWERMRSPGVASERLPAPASLDWDCWESQFADSCFRVDSFAPHLFSGRRVFISLIFTPGLVYLFEISSF